MQITEDFMRDPYPVYAGMRESAPLHLSDANAGRTWFVPRYADVIDVLRDDRFSAALKAPGFINQFPPEHRAEFQPFNDSVSGWVVLQDPPAHRQLRRLMNKGFTRRLVASLRPKVTEIAAGLIDEMAKRRSGDFMTDFAQPFPAAVIATMFGVPAADLSAFISWSDDIVQFAGSLRPTLEVARAAQHGLLSMNEFFRALLPQRRADPGDDVISLLVGVRDDGEQLTDEQVLANCAQLIVAGHETTRNLVANGLWTLLNHPAQLEKLKADPSLMTSAIREMMRFESPLQFIRRVAREDFTYLGAEIKAHDGVVTILGSANRDPDVFADPDRFDITRNPIGHVALGYGPHVCLGAVLAEMETEVALGLLLNRFPGLRAADADPRRVMNPMLRGFAELRLEW
ncbi:cytochrome P450 [Streptomyces sp. NPDC038707]|uniref:cytochrome P450 n=1 Tax=unclassified Streptomyces TaxID=2593676 RepID=UPI0033E9BBD0